MPSRGRDAVIAVLLAAAAYATAVWYVRTVVAAGFQPSFYQFEFRPAVMLACGRGFVSPAQGEAPVLDQFLDVRRDAMQCADIPDSVRTEPLSLSQSVWKYLLWTAAGIWAIRGISWSALVALSGVLFAATVVMSFLLARFVCGRIAASAVAAGMLLSPLHWSQLPHVRDYSKAPFMFALFALMALAARAPMRPRRLLLLSTAFGAVLGVGFGFRNDLLVVFPAFAVTVACFLPGGLRQHLAVKAAAVAAALVALVIAMLPLLGPYGEGGGMQVLALLGFATPFDQELKVDRGPYEFGHVYSDWYMGAIVRDFARRERHVAEPIPLYRGQYNAAATQLLVDTARTLPADLLVRGYASMLNIASLPVSNATDSHLPPMLPPAGLWARFFAWRSHALEDLGWVGPAAVVAALAAGSVVDLRLSLFASFLLVYFAAYPAIQFHERHFFHLNVVPMMAIAFLCTQAGRWSRARIRDDSHPRAFAGAARAVAFCGALTAFVVIPLATLRAYQAPRVRSALATRLAAAREPIVLQSASMDGRRVRLEPTTLPAEREARDRVGIVTSEYLVVRVGGASCDALRVPVTLSYDAPSPKSDFTRTIDVRIPGQGDADVQIVAPVFFRYRPDADATNLTDRFSSYQFRGFMIDERDRPCVRSAERIVDAAAFPLMLAAVLEPGWEHTPLYQRIPAVEGSRNSAALRAFTMPADLRLAKAVVDSPLTPLKVTARAEALRPVGSGWVMDGPGAIGSVPGPFGYVLSTETRATAAGDQLIVQGVLHEGGGLTIGLLRGDAWLAQTPVTVAGPFIAVVEVPSDGESTVVVANNLAGGRLSNHFAITRAGWLNGGHE